MEHVGLNAQGKLDEVHGLDGLMETLLRCDIRRLSRRSLRPQVHHQIEKLLSVPGINAAITPPANKHHRRPALRPIHRPNILLGTSTASSRANFTCMSSRKKNTSRKPKQYHPRISFLLLLPTATSTSLNLESPSWTGRRRKLASLGTDSSPSDA